MRNQIRDRNRINRNITLILFIVLVLVLLASIAIGIKRNGINLLSASNASSESESQKQEKWQEGIVEYNGKNYQYNKDLKVYLFMGIDTDYTVEEAKQYEEGGGQSDAMFLLVADKEAKELSVISINRNSMTSVEVFSESGKSLGTYDLQICLQHAYGDGGQLSCSRTVEAVSYLFYNLPIDGYFSINMGGVPLMNDAVGGVEVEVLEDLDSGEVHLTKGETVLLDGKQAYAYLRSRDTEVFDSSSQRLRRQEQYLSSLMMALKSTVSNDSSRALSIYDALSEYVVTNISVGDVVTELMDYSYDPDSMKTVPGKTVMGEEYEEYQVDSQELYELVIDIFYREVAE